MNRQEREWFIAQIGAEHYKRKTSPESEVSVTGKYTNQDNTLPHEEVKSKKIWKNNL